MTHLRHARPSFFAAQTDDFVKKTGRVSVAKFGSPGSKERVERLQKQIRASTKTSLILIAKSGADFLGFHAPIVSLRLGMATSEIRASTPSYYRDLYMGGLWFVVDAPFESIDLARFCLVTNGRPLLDVVRQSRTASMLVKRQS
jgi:hypothetical protein